MAPPRTRRPQPGDCAPYYASYIAEVPDGDILGTLLAQGQQTVQTLTAVPQDREGFRYAPGKWTLKEVVGHVNDAERLFTLRALAFARREPARLFGMDENLWAAAGAADHDRRPLRELVEEFEAMRRATVCLFRGFGDASWEARGIASDVEFTAGSIAWILAGHERHHLRVIREKYLGPGAQAGGGAC